MSKKLVGSEPSSAQNLDEYHDMENSGISSTEKSKNSKDQILFQTFEQQMEPLSREMDAILDSLDEEDELDEPNGPLLPNGEINWECPCMASMVAGPCGFEFREAFACFHNSKAEPKGSDCYGKMESMAECMSKFPTLYGKSEENDKEFSLEDLQEKTNQAKK